MYHRLPKPRDHILLIRPMAHISQQTILLHHPNLLVLLLVPMICHINKVHIRLLRVVTEVNRDMELMVGVIIRLLLVHINLALPLRARILKLHISRLRLLIKPYHRTSSGLLKFYERALLRRMEDPTAFVAPYVLLQIIRLTNLRSLLASSIPLILFLLFAF